MNEQNGKILHFVAGAEYFPFLSIVFSMKSNFNLKIINHTALLYKFGQTLGINKKKKHPEVPLSL